MSFEQDIQTLVEYCFGQKVKIDWSQVECRIIRVGSLEKTKSEKCFGYGFQAGHKGKFTTKNKETYYGHEISHDDSDVIVKTFYPARTFFMDPILGKESTVKVTADIQELGLDAEDVKQLIKTGKIHEQAKEKQYNIQLDSVSKSSEIRVSTYPLQITHSTEIEWVLSGQIAVRFKKYGIFSKHKTISFQDLIERVQSKLSRKLPKIIFNIIKLFRKKSVTARTEMISEIIQRYQIYQDKLFCLRSMQLMTYEGVQVDYELMKKSCHAVDKLITSQNNLKEKLSKIEQTDIPITLEKRTFLSGEMNPYGESPLLLAITKEYLRDEHYIVLFLSLEKLVRNKFSHSGVGFLHTSQQLFAKSVDSYFSKQTALSWNSLYHYLFDKEDFQFINMSQFIQKKSLILLIDKFDEHLLNNLTPGEEHVLFDFMKDAETVVVRNTTRADMHDLMPEKIAKRFTPISNLSEGADLKQSYIPKYYMLPYEIEGIAGSLSDFYKRLEALSESNRVFNEVYEEFQHPIMRNMLYSASIDSFLDSENDKYFLLEAMRGLIWTSIFSSLDNHYETNCMTRGGALLAGGAKLLAMVEHFALRSLIFNEASIKDSVDYAQRLFEGQHGKIAIEQFSLTTLGLEKQNFSGENHFKFKIFTAYFAACYLHNCLKQEKQIECRDHGEYQHHFYLRNTKVSEFIAENRSNPELNLMFKLMRNMIKSNCSKNEKVKDSLLSAFEYSKVKNYQPRMLFNRSSNNSAVHSGNYVPGERLCNQQ